MVVFLIQPLCELNHAWNGSNGSFQPYIHLKLIIIKIFKIIFTLIVAKCISTFFPMFGTVVKMENIFLN